MGYYRGGGYYRAGQEAAEAMDALEWGEEAPSLLSELEEDEAPGGPAGINLASIGGGGLGAIGRALKRGSKHVEKLGPGGSEGLKHFMGVRKRHRRMNPGNFRALRRAERRLKAFVHAARRVYTFTQRHKLKHRRRRR